MVIERQVIVTWFKPEEKLPEENVMVVATVSGEAEGVDFDHAIVMMYYDPDEGWYSVDWKFKSVTVHAWCDLEPYGG